MTLLVIENAVNNLLDYYSYAVKSSKNNIDVIGLQTQIKNSEAFDFYCEYAKFDFSRFDVSWLLNLYPHTLEQIAKNAKIKERVRVAIATTLDGEAIAPSDSQRLQSILVKHFC